MTKPNSSTRITRSMMTLATLTLALTLLSLPIGKAKTNLRVVSAPGDTCVNRALVKVDKVQYQGKDSGNDKVYVEWRVGSASPPGDHPISAMGR